MSNQITRRFAAKKIVTAGAAGMAVVAANAAQPNMEDALTHLKGAKESLEKANANKGGHRVAAIKLIDQAMDEVKKGIAAAG